MFKLKEDAAPAISGTPTNTVSSTPKVDVPLGNTGEDIVMKKRKTKLDIVHDIIKRKNMENEGSQI